MGGTASNSTVFGQVVVSAGGRANGATLSGGELDANQIFISGTVVDSGGLLITTGSTDSATTINSAGREIADGGLTARAVVNNGGTLALVSETTSATGNDIVVKNGGTLSVDGGSVVSGTSFEGGSVFDLTDLAFMSGGSASIDQHDLLTVTEGAEVYHQQLASTASGGTIGVVSDGSGGTKLTFDAVACYCPGTLILTDRGEMPIETLRVGDYVVTMDGDEQRIIWMGYRRIDCRVHPRARTVWPVRVEAGAFGRGLPHHDLWLSPGHGVLVEGTMLPIERLINGATITAVPVDSVTYWHVELAQHTVILANGAPAESYLDTGNRNAFENGGGALELHPDFSSIKRADVRKSFPTSRLAVMAARDKILGVAERLGYTLTADVDVQVVVDGVTISPCQVGGDRYTFDLPAIYSEAWLASPHFVPMQVRPKMTDLRRLGVRLSGMWLDGKAVPLADLSDDGWYKPETARGKIQKEARWTNGLGRLPAGARQVIIELIPELRAWVRREAGAGNKTGMSGDLRISTYPVVGVG